jgi:hypothetical protein
MATVFVSSLVSSGGPLSYTFVDLQTDLQFLLGENTFSTWSQDQQKRQLNLAYQEVCNEAHWKFTEAETLDAVVANIGDYDLPGDIVGNPYEVRWNNGTQYVQLQKIEFRIYQSIEKSGTGNPKYYTVWNGQYHVNPTPATTLANGFKIRHKAVPPFLVNDTDSPIVPGQYRMAIVYRAAVRCFGRTKDIAMLREYQALYLEQIQNMRRDLPRVEQEWEIVKILDTDEASINKVIVT